MIKIANSIPYVSNEKYTIYELYSNMAIPYHLYIPNNDYQEVNLYIGFPTNNRINSTKKDIINEVISVTDNISENNKNNIYVLLEIDFEKLKEAATENDDKLYNELLKNISSITSDVFKKIAINNKINQTITAVKQTSFDTKFINWLEIKLPSFINGIELPNNYNKMSDNDTQEIDPIDNSKIGIQKNNTYTRKKVMKKNNNGTANIMLLVITLALVLTVGFNIVYYLLKFKNIS